jgi:hypothetical protein
MEKVGKPAVWTTLLAASRDALAVVREAPGLAALTTTLAFAEAVTYEAAYATLDQGLPTALLMTADTVAVCLIVTPLSVATFRWVLLHERPGFSSLVNKLDVLVAFALVTTAIWSAAFAPLALPEGVQPEEAPLRFWGGVAGFVALTALSMRFLFLQPALAARSVLANVGATWRMTYGVSWRLLGALTALFAPALAITLAVATLGHGPAPYTISVIVGSLNILIGLVGSAVVARYYAWRLTQL